MLHLIKLCVGADSLEALRSWQAERLAERRRRGLPPELHHTTRQMPKQRAALLEGGSLYWVIRGQIAGRQRLIGLDAVLSEDGQPCCLLRLAPDTVPTALRPRGPFQGWRYLKGEEAPPDLDAGAGVGAGLPEAMARELALLGLR